MSEYKDALNGIIASLKVFTEILNLMLIGLKKTRIIFCLF